MSEPNDKQPTNNPTLAELRAKAFAIVEAAKATAKLRRQVAKDEVSDIRRRTNADLAARRRALLRELQQSEKELKLALGSAMLDQIAEHGLENACLTPAEFKSSSADAYAELLIYIRATKELEDERSSSRKKRAPKGAKIEAKASKPDEPVDGNSTESGETH